MGHSKCVVLNAASCPQTPESLLEGWSPGHLLWVVGPAGAESACPSQVVHTLWQSTSITA